MTGFGQYPDSVFKEQVSEAREVQAVYPYVRVSVCAGHGGAPPSDGEAGKEVRPAQPLQQGPRQCAGQSLDSDGPRPGGDQGGQSAEYDGQQRGELVGHGRHDQTHTCL